MSGSLCRRLFSIVVILSLGLGFFGSARSQEEPAPRLAEPGRYKVYRIELREAITSEHVSFFIHRAVVAAKAAKADAVILDINTPGGRLDLTTRIRDDLITLKMPSYAYVNNQAASAGALIAIAMDKIIMSPFSAIGAAQPITATGQELPEKVDRKIISFLKGEVRATAKYKGHPYRICEAFVDPTIEIPGLTPVGEPLTMDQDEATTFYGLVDENDPTSSETLAAFVAVDIEDILKHDGLWPADIHEYEMTWSENLAKFLMGIKALLLLVGIAALYLEVKTPGLGAPAAVGVLALSLFFWGSYLADFARFLEIALFILGILLLLVEIFVIPGFGVAGLAGIALVLVSLVLAMVKLPSENIPGLSQWSTQALSHAIWQVIIVFVALVPIIYILAKFLPATPIFRKLVLNPETAAAESERMRAAPVGLRLEKPRPGEALLGVEGTALTDLRPSGMALIDNRRVDVVTEGGYISAGSRVRVIEVHGNYHVVAEAPQK